MVCQVRDHPLIQKVSQLYEKISSLDDLRPSKDVDTLFTQLVLTCIPPSPVDVNKLPCPNLQLMRSHLIQLCGKAESLLESHFSTLLGYSYDFPLNHLHIFPYYSNYIYLSRLEFSILKDHSPADGHFPRKVAFVGSGPLPLTSIILARDHLTGSIFYNYDIDPSAVSMAEKLVSSDPDLSKRVLFRTSDILNVTEELGDYDVVFLAALVGMNREEKARVVEHLSRYMKAGSVLMARSAHGARAFLYPVLEQNDLPGLRCCRARQYTCSRAKSKTVLSSQAIYLLSSQVKNGAVEPGNIPALVLSVFHPSDEVINSVVIARKCPQPSVFLAKESNVKHFGGCNKCSDQFSCFDYGNNNAIDSGLILKEKIIPRAAPSFAMNRCNSCA